MAVEIIYLSKFESALISTKAQNLGIVQGEYSFWRPIDSNPLFGVYVRSSIGASKISDETGKDSIRVYLAKKVENRIELVGFSGHWLTRSKGWESRLLEKMREIYGAFIRKEYKTCPICGEILIINKIKKLNSPNKGKMFGACPKKEHFKPSFVILEK